MFNYNCFQGVFESGLDTCQELFRDVSLVFKTTGGFQRGMRDLRDLPFLHILERSTVGEGKCVIFAAPCRPGVVAPFSHLKSARKTNSVNTRRLRPGRCRMPWCFWPSIGLADGASWPSVAWRKASQRRLPNGWVVRGRNSSAQWDERDTWSSSSRSTEIFF